MSTVPLSSSLHNMYVMHEWLFVMSSEYKKVRKNIAIKPSPKIFLSNDLVAGAKQAEEVEEEARHCNTHGCQPTYHCRGVGFHPCPLQPSTRSIRCLEDVLRALAPIRRVHQRQLYNRAAIAKSSYCHGFPAKNVSLETMTVKAAMHGGPVVAAVDGCGVQK